MWVSHKIGVTVKMSLCRQVSCQCSNLMQRWDEQNTCPLVLDCRFSVRDLVVNLAIAIWKTQHVNIDGKTMKIHHEIRCVLLEKGWLPVPSLPDRRVSACSFASGFTRASLLVPLSYLDCLQFKRSNTCCAEQDCMWICVNSMSSFVYIASRLK